MSPAVRRRARGVPDPVVWLGDRVRILDQTRLPGEERYVEARTPAAIALAIRTLAVRGAPLLGIAAGYGVALLVSSRPTAVNIPRAVRRTVDAAGGIGTAQGVIMSALEAGRSVHVWVGETRPVLQGARLTAWELQRAGAPMTLVADAAAGSLMARGLVNLLVVGADRVAANGDTANKIGTDQLAILARHHRIPFYVAAPVSTVDLATPNGAVIVVEERDPNEVTRPFGVAFAPARTVAANPPFDVTPAGSIDAIVTDRGLARPPYRSSLRSLAGGSP